jgi:hypothetical protein
MFNNSYFWKPCRLWDNVGEKKSQSRTRHRCQYGACVNMLDNQGCTYMHTHTYIHTHTHTNKICNTYCFSTATMITLTFLNVTLHAHCPSCQCLWNIAVEWAEFAFRNQKGPSSNIGPDTPLSSWWVFCLYRLANTITVLQIGHQRFPTPPPPGLFKVRLFKVNPFTNHLSFEVV